MSDLPEGLTLITPANETNWCFYCQGRISPATQEHVVFWTKLPITRFERENEQTVFDCGGFLEGPVGGPVAFVRRPRVGHVGCVERAKLIIEDGYVVGWDCHCCRCKDEWPSALCRNHGGAHDTNACELHRQPAFTCDCGCREPAVGT